MDDIQRAIENMSNYVRWGMPSVKKEHAKIAISAMLELQQYRQIGTPEECRQTLRKQAVRTNAERIRHMTDEELAVTIVCPNEMGIAEIECDHSDTCNCSRCCLEWLQKEEE